MHSFYLQSLSLTGNCKNTTSMKNCLWLKTSKNNQFLFFFLTLHCWIPHTLYQPYFSRTPSPVETYLERAQSETQFRKMSLKELKMKSIYSHSQTSPLYLNVAKKEKKENISLYFAGLQGFTRILQMAVFQCCSSYLTLCLVGWVLCNG